MSHPLSSCILAIRAVGATAGQPPAEKWKSYETEQLSGPVPDESTEIDHPSLVLVAGGSEVLTAVRFNLYPRQGRIVRMVCYQD